MMKSVMEYLNNTAELYAEKVAFEDDNRKLTFRELQTEAKAIATVIAKKNMFKKPIAIFMDKCVECVVAFMGVAYSGNFYTPIDSKMPVARIEKILETLVPEILITDKKHFELAKSFFDTSNILLYEEIRENVIDKYLLKLIDDKIIDTDILYVLFTSGSTGIPKGVTISHKSLIAYIEWGSKEFKISNKEIIGNQTPFYFSMSIFDIYQTIKNGCTMIIIPKLFFSYPIKLLEFINIKNINLIYWVPTALCLVANLKALGKRNITCLKKILFAGESMPTKQLNMWIDVLPEAMFANLYGPTEATDICCFYRVDRKLDNKEIIPIGKACDNCRVLILDYFNKEVRNNSQGELCVIGAILADGYYNNLQKTNEVFVQNPLNTAYPEKIYRTGDLVKYNEYGELIYISRKDFQIKHMGHRIELGEIEAAVSSLQGIDLNCCLYDEKNNKIILFYVGNLQEDDIINLLKECLPDYMLPNKKIKLQAMPINLNGKIDRVKLKELL